MTLTAQYDEADIWPDSGILLIRDTGVVPDVPAAFDRFGLDVQPCGTIARTGHGWLEAGAGDGPLVARLRAHEAEPAPDDEAWDDLLEIPYRSLTGAVQFADLMGSADEDQLWLAAAGDYRVRVAHRSLPAAIEVGEDEDAPTDQWQFDFWPVQSSKPPRWFRRERPAVRAADPGWSYLLDFSTIDVVETVWYAGQGEPVSLDQLRAWTADHGRGSEWLDEPFAPTMNGRLELAEVAAQVDVPVPPTRRAVLDLFTRLGYLAWDGDSYAAPAQRPFAYDVIQLAPELRAQLEYQLTHNRLTSFASDLVSVALWGSGSQTLTGLAELTLTSEDDVRAGLAFAHRHLRVDGDLDGEFTLELVQPSRR